VSSPDASDAPAPPRGLFAVGAAGLVFEAIVVLLAAVALASPGHGHRGAAIGYLLGLAVVLILIAGLLRRRGGVVAGTAVQVAVVAAGVFTWPMYVVGVVFAAIWGYWLHLRRTAQ